MKCANNRCGNSVLEELERGFQELVRGVPNGSLIGTDDPRLTVLELSDRYVVECDLPGVPSEDISINVEEDVLCISGRRRSAFSKEGTKVIFSEHSGGDFSRRIRLAKHVDQTAIDAELKHGVLSVSIPKRSEMLPQKIQIRTGASGSINS
jgi:HSP20 family protein